MMTGNKPSEQARIKAMYREERLRVAAACLAQFRLYEIRQHDKGYRQCDLADDLGITANKQGSIDSMTSHLVRGIYDKRLTPERLLCLISQLGQGGLGDIIINKVLGGESMLPQMSLGEHPSEADQDEDGTVPEDDPEDANDEYEEEDVSKQDVLRAMSQTVTATVESLHGIISGLEMLMQGER